MCDIGFPLVRQNTSEFSTELAKSLSQNEALILIVSLCHDLETCFYLFSVVSFHLCHDAVTSIEANDVHIKKKNLSDISKSRKGQPTSLKMALTFLSERKSQ